MAAEWVGVVATGMTGVAGMAFAWLTSRHTADVQVRIAKMNNEHSREEELRLDRRAVFADYLASLDAFDRCVASSGMTITSSGESESDDEEVRARETARLRAGLEDMEQPLQEVLLVGSADVGRATLLLRDDALEVVDLCRNGDWRFISSKLRKDLIDAMREDLGVDGGEAASP